MAHAHGADQVGVDDVGERAGAKLRALTQHGARVVDEDVEAVDVVHRLLDRQIVGDVELQRRHLAERRGGTAGCQRLAGPRGHEHLRPGLKQGARDRVADAARAAGDKRDLAGEVNFPGHAASPCLRG